MASFATVGEQTDEVWQVKYEDLEFYEEIGSGQFGKVFKADYFGATVGVKKVSKDPGQDKIMIKFIQREIEILKYNHPNIVTLIGVAEKGDELFLVTEYCEGGDLCKYLRDPHINLPWALRARMATDIACAMAFLHAKNITHRDLKSQNCLVTENWRVKLCDFGFARKVAGVAQPAYMTLCGTDDFMSPEIILGEDYDERSDIFSFGLLLCEIIIRKRICDVLPRTPATFFGVEEKMFWSQIPKDCPQAISQLAWNCVSYYPKDRPAFKEVMSRLRAIEKELVLASPQQTPTIVLESVQKNEKKKHRHHNEHPEKKLFRLDSIPILIEAGSEMSEASDLFGPEPSPRRKKNKQDVLKQLVEEFFKRNDKREKKEKDKEDKKHMKEEEKRQHKEEKKLREEEKKRAEANNAGGDTKTKKNLNKLAFSESELLPPPPSELPSSPGHHSDEEEKEKKKKSHRISLNLAGLHDKEKKHATTRRTNAVGKTMQPDVTVPNA